MIYTISLQFLTGLRLAKIAIFTVKFKTLWKTTETRMLTSFR